MSEKTKKFENELDLLIASGNRLHMAIQYECHPKEFKSQINETIGKENSKKYIEELPDFKSEYQPWYTESRALIKQALPDRLDDFISYYECPRVRKDISFQNYMIRDYLQGLQITRGLGTEIIVDGSAAIPEFVQQLNIVKAAKETLQSSLIDLKFNLQADLFDSELDSARALAKSGFKRAAGAIGGVVIEKHLKQVCSAHGIVIRKKYPGISDFSQVLKDNGTVTLPQWRFIQHLADIRNICDHAKGREPTKEEIDDLLSGSDKILKTVF